MTQPTPEQLRLARDREFLLGQVSVDIEIALNKAGILLTQEQGYIAAEAAIQATEARIAALEDALRERMDRLPPDAERLAKRLEEKAHNHTQDDIAEWSYMTEAATLLRAQSARIAALEDEVKALSGMLEEADRHAQQGWGKAFKALGKGSE